MDPKIHAGAGGSRTLSFTVEGKTYTTNEQFLTGAEIKRIAGLSADVELYLSISSPWKDDQITDQEQVDLARPEIEHFYVKKKLPYKINGQPFESESQYIQGKKIRRQGNIAADHDIFLSIAGLWDDEKVQDDDFINLARPGLEQFYSKQKHTEIILIVNGREKKWNDATITYRQVVELAYGNYVENDQKVYTVTYKRGPEQNPEGSMVTGDRVFVKNKMIFNVTQTDKS
ncbi:MAG: multiubiquitin domain-containing protein [Candidatus Pseudobacter hemicellulosilyticus]|uniref:Multiubiquitin domain-containing protein n=1 Tax=Candidatus Pseudobacter hemicellulosilyticus TaxID=3121375 RepID=A0AAJ6BI47_9BACT|nr:MAG: multiubiquitin domain-containing protein [Pseudobacter sp.]